jgi:hypothetical protein
MADDAICVSRLSHDEILIAAPAIAAIIAARRRRTTRTRFREEPAD